MLAHGGNFARLGDVGSYHHGATAGFLDRGAHGTKGRQVATMHRHLGTCRANSFAMPAPMPRELPVTNAILPSNSRMDRL
jgi:hypothetical protein